jgi:hypothetical protein
MSQRGNLCIDLQDIAIGVAKNSVRWPNGWSAGGETIAAPRSASVAAQASTSCGATRKASCNDMTPTGGNGSLNRGPDSARARILEPTRYSTHFGESSRCNGNPIVDP